MIRGVGEPRFDCINYMPHEIKHTRDFKKCIFYNIFKRSFPPPPLKKYTEPGIKLFKATFALHSTNYNITREITFDVNPLYQSYIYWTVCHFNS